MESNQHREPWNKGKLVGQKPPLKPADIRAIFARHRKRETSHASPRNWVVCFVKQLKQMAGYSY